VGKACVRRRVQQVIAINYTRQAGKAPKSSGRGSTPKRLGGGEPPGKMCTCPKRAGGEETALCEKKLKKISAVHIHKQTGQQWDVGVTKTGEKRKKPPDVPTFRLRVRVAHRMGLNEARGSGTFRPKGPRFFHESWRREPKGPRFPNQRNKGNTRKLTRVLRVKTCWEFVGTAKKGREKGKRHSRKPLWGKALAKKKKNELEMITEWVQKSATRKGMDENERRLLVQTGFSRHIGGAGGRGQRRKRPLGRIVEGHSKVSVAKNSKMKNRLVGETVPSCLKNKRRLSCCNQLREKRQSQLGGPKP